MKDFRRPNFKWLGQGFGLLILGLLPAQSAFAILPCELKCSPSTQCSNRCFDAFGEIITCGEYGSCISGPVYDMVQWMLPSYSGHTTTHLRQSASGNNGVKSELTTCSSFPNGFFRVSSTCGDLQERFVFDNNDIFITRETFPPLSATHFKTHDRFSWVRRFMRAGESYVTDCSWREHQGSCTTPPKVPCSILVRLVGPVTVPLGGDLGTVQALVVEHVVGGGFVERYFYARPYGYVKFEFRSPSGALQHQEIFNKITSGNLWPKAFSCFGVECGGNPNTCQ